MGNLEGLLLALAVLALILMVIFGFRLGKSRTEKRGLGSFAAGHGWADETGKDSLPAAARKHIHKNSKHTMVFALAGQIDRRATHLVRMREKIGPLEHRISALRSYVILELPTSAPFFSLTRTAENDIPGTTPLGAPDFDARFAVLADDSDFAKALLTAENRDLVSNALGEFGGIVIEDDVLVGAFPRDVPPEELEILATRLAAFLGNVRDDRFRF